jgi:hypothetical protein
MNRLLLFVIQLVVLAFMLYAISYADEHEEPPSRPPNDELNAVEFYARWTEPTKDQSGKQATADDYILYVCDKKITERVRTSNADGPLVGECDGTLNVYINRINYFSSVYFTDKNAGKIYARVSARRHILSRTGQVVILESDLSNEVAKHFKVEKK